MKKRNDHKLAAVLLAVLMLLGLAACDGEQSRQEEPPAPVETDPEPAQTPSSGSGPSLRPIPSAGVDHVRLDAAGGPAPVETPAPTRSLAAPLGT